jgi:hypothetical protein
MHDLRKLCKLNLLICFGVQIYHTMSYFSEALDAHMSTKSLTNAELGELTGLSHTEFSRWRRDVAQPTDKALAKLLPVLAPEVALQLCIAWLRDETPADMRSKIVIQPSKIENVVDLTREDWQQALEFFTKGCEHNPLMRETLVGLHRLMTQEHEETSPPGHSSSGGNRSDGLPPKEPLPGSGGAGEGLALASETPTPYGTKADGTLESEGSSDTSQDPAERAAKEFLKESGGGGDEPPAQGTQSGYRRKVSPSLQPGGNAGDN